MMSKTQKAILKNAQKKLEEKVMSVSDKASEFRKGFGAYEQAAKELGKESAVYVKARVRFDAKPENQKLKEIFSAAEEAFDAKKNAYLELKKQNDELLTEIHATYDVLRSVGGDAEKVVNAVNRTEEQFGKEETKLLAKIEKYVQKVDWN